MTAPGTSVTCSGAGFVSLPPPPRPAIPQSPGPGAGSHSHSHQTPMPNPYRPVGPTRRHTHDRFSPESEPALERNGRAMKLDSRSLGRARVRSGLRKPTFDFDSEVGSEASKSYYAPSTKTYAHTLGSDDRSSSRHSLATSIATTSPATRMEKTRPGNPRRSTSSVRPSSPLATGTSHSSFTEKRFKNSSHPALSTITSSRTIDFTQTAPSSATFNMNPHHPSSMNMQALNAALPPVPQTAPLQGYIPPDSEDGYDPYEAHPAPANAVLTHSVEKPKAANKPPGAGLKHVSPDSYRPPGFPKPVKELAWNREGPAMKTHGVAWLREAELDALPGGPAGPRYIQARPPALAIQNGSSWWESAA